MDKILMFQTEKLI